MRLFLVLTAASLLAGCADTGQKSPAALAFESKENERLAKDLAGMEAGKPQTCIRLRDAGGNESYGENVLLFRVSRSLVYKTETKGSCRNVRRNDVLVTRTFGSDLCRGDIAHTADVQAGFQTGSCAMGDFVPYRRVAAR